MKIKRLCMCLMAALMLGGMTTNVFSMENQTTEEKAAKKEGAVAGAEEDAVNPTEEGLQSIRITLQTSGKSKDYIKTYIEAYKAAYEAANKEREEKEEKAAAAEEALPGAAELKQQEDAAKGRKEGTVAGNKDVEAGVRNKPITTGNTAYDKAYNKAYSLIMQKTLPEGPKVAMAGRVQAREHFKKGTYEPNLENIKEDYKDVFLEAYKKTYAEEKEKKDQKEAPKTPEQTIAEEEGFQAGWFTSKKKKKAKRVRFAEEKPDVKKLTEALDRLKTLLGNLKAELAPK